MTNLQINEYQERAHEFAFYTSPVVITSKGGHIALPFTYAVQGLAEESGEVCGKFAKILRDKNGIVSPEDVTAISKELGDVLWMVSEICTNLGIDLESVMAGNLQKLTDRANRGMLSGSGDNR